VAPSELRRPKLAALLAGDFLFSVSFPSQQDNLCRKNGGPLDRRSLTTDKQEISIRRFRVSLPWPVSLLTVEQAPDKSAVSGSPVSKAQKIKGYVF
jgi:hypothetical protein